MTFAPAPSVRRVVATAVVASVVTVGAAGCNVDHSSPDASSANVPRVTPEIIAEYQWDSSSFTQGLEFDSDGSLVVGTGMYGASEAYRTDLVNKTPDDAQPGGAVPTLQKRDEQRLDPKFFGEGLTIHDYSVWQLTWKEGTAFRRDRNTLQETATASYDGEGWGLCSDGDRLIMSDGSGTLTFRDPETFAPTGNVKVTLDGKDTSELNELECGQSSGGHSNGIVWANVWQTNEIYKIDAATGEVTEVIDTTGLFPAATRPGADVLNGIAQIPGKDEFLLTGKYWDTAYKVRFS